MNDNSYTYELIQYYIEMERQYYIDKDQEALVEYMNTTEKQNG